MLPVVKPKSMFSPTVSLCSLCLLPKVVLTVIDNRLFTELVMDSLIPKGPKTDALPPLIRTSSSSDKFSMAKSLNFKIEKESL